MLYASPVGAASGADPASDASSRSLSFVALACDSFSRVPASIRVEPTLDETGGGYLSWGPSAGLVVAEPDGAETAGCRPVDGVRFRLSAIRDGAALAVGSPSRLAAGAEDGQLTTVSPATGTGGAGRVTLAGSDLTPAQQEALVDETAAGGLWVSADGLTGSFAGLRCHRDQTNGDNLEVLRAGVVDTSVACVAYTVQAPPVAAPNPVPVAVPSPPVAIPVVPPTPAVPTPGASAAVIAAPVVAAPVVAAPPVARPPAAVSEITPPVAAPPPADPVPAVPLPPNPPVAAGLVPQSPPRKLEPSPEEEAALGPSAITSMEIVIEVGGVTRGSKSARVDSARSPWVRPVQVDLRCPGERSRILDLAVGSVPGAQVSTGPLPAGRGVDACLIGLAEDGVDGRAGLVRVQWGDTVLSEGQYSRIEPRGSGTQVLRLQVTYGAAEEPTAADSAFEASPGDAGANRLHPALLLSLAGLGIGGIVAAASLSWRGRRSA